MSRLFLSLRIFSAAAISVFFLFSIGCMPIKPVRVAAVAMTMQDVASATAKQSDPDVFREGASAYLMLVDGLIEAYPDNRKLLTAGCQAYSTYASSLPDDRNTKRSKALYQKAKSYGFRALSTDVDFESAAQGNVQEFRSTLQQFNKKDVPELFCTASAWASWIASDIGSVEAVADLPALEATMERILELDETHNYGSPHVMMGIYLAAKPAMLGGDLAKARQHFERAFALGGARVLATKVLFAQYYAREAKDRDLYVKTLEEVIAARADEIPELTLVNALAKEKAETLIEKADEYFSDPLEEL
jgi:tetratricopeptide (TPR) repeat protein